MFQSCPLFLIFWVPFLTDVILKCGSVTIDIPQGRISGLLNYSDNMTAYLGIPYATVLERYQEPGPPPVWNNTFHAVHESKTCQQMNSSTLKPIGQKDCLDLNVFTPISLHKRLLPVIIFIHGGGFSTGCNHYEEYDPKYLVNKDVIVVTINYRLGAFGFLCLQTPELRGNAGLYDQVAAIRWVKSNIQYFGGNPDSITLYGQSVGATSISFLLLSSETDGLFQHAILSSGSLMVPYAFDKDPVGTASRIASRMGYKTRDPEELLKIYQNTSSDDILMASHFNDINDPLAPYVFRPCIDKSKGSLVKGSPKEIIQSTTLERNTTIVIGYNNMEGIKWAERYNDDGLKNLNETFSKIIPLNLIFACEEERSTFEAEVKDFYFKNNTLDIYTVLVNYFSDSIIMYPLVATTKYFLGSNVLLPRVYNYYFQYDSNRNLGKLETTLAWMNGSSHSDDLYYVFDSSKLQSVPMTSMDAAIIDALTSFWSNVAKTGNLSTTDVFWRGSKRGELKFLSIDKKMEMIPLPNKERIRFWQKVYEKYNSC